MNDRHLLFSIRSIGPPDHDSALTLGQRLFAIRPDLQISSSRFLTPPAVWLSCAARLEPIVPGAFIQITQITRVSLFPVEQFSGQKLGRGQLSLDS